METNLIEKYDKSKTNLLIGITIGWGVYYGIFIFNDLIDNSVIVGIMKIIGLIGLGVYLFGLIRMIRIKQTVKKDPELQNALNNEWIIQNRRIAYTIGFWDMLICVLAGTLLVEFTNINAKIILELILFTGILSLLLTFIILNKRG